MYAFAPIAVLGPDVSVTTLFPCEAFCSCPSDFGHVLYGELEYSFPDTLNQLAPVHLYGSGQPPPAVPPRKSPFRSSSRSTGTGPAAEDEATRSPCRQNTNDATRTSRTALRPDLPFRFTLVRVTARPPPAPAASPKWPK